MTESIHTRHFAPNPADTARMAPFAELHQALARVFAAFAPRHRAPDQKRFEPDRSGSEMLFFRYLIARF